MLTRRGTTAALTALVLLGACASDDGDDIEAAVETDGDDAAASDEPDADDEAAPDGPADEETSEDAPADDGPATDAPTAPTGEIAVGQTLVHPSGVEVTVESVRVEADAIFIQLDAFNGRGAEVRLAAFRGASLTDDTGRDYRYQPPEDNSSLVIEQDGTLTGSIAFLGRVGPDATSLTLRLNYDADGEPFQAPDGEDAAVARTPSFEFTDLPMPRES